MNELLLASTLVLAFANGANDNIKGAATLYGCGGLDYRRALWLGTLSVALGSLLSMFFAEGLVRAFTAKGLIPDSLLDARFLSSVATGAAGTVLLATRLGLPISTTHGILGGLAGAGLVVAGTSLDFAALVRGFALPLLLSPALAVALAMLSIWLGRRVFRGLGAAPDACVCVSPGRAELQLVDANVALRSGLAPALEIETGTVETCPAHGARIERAGLDRAVDVGHLLSATAVGVARGLNDTAKILGLLIGASVVAPLSGAVLITGAMAIGGLVAARRVAHTLALRITPMSPGEGLAGNLATSFLVIGASRLGVPVSTTHVSTGGIFGIGLTNGELRGGAARQVLMAWLLTLPIAALLSAACMALIVNFF